MAKLQQFSGECSEVSYETTTRYCVALNSSMEDSSPVIKPSCGRLHDQLKQKNKKKKNGFWLGPKKTG